jgi:glycine/D-amino acid oxidase-like deaminating enzyme
MSVSYWQDTDAGHLLRVDCDVLIIGAGLAGLSTSYWLRKKDPTLRVVIVDRGRIGEGASGRNGGFITSGSTEHFSRMAAAYGEDKATEIWKFTEDNHKLLIEEFGFNFLHKVCDYRQQGSWTLASTPAEVVTVCETVDMLTQRGVQVGWHNKYEIEQRFRPSEHHPVCVEGFLGGARYYSDGEIHPGKFLQFLANRANFAAGGGVLENVEIFKFDEVGERLLAIGRGHRITCDSIVVATNAWTPQLLPEFEDKIAPVRGQIVMTEPVDMFLEPCYCSFVLDYFRQLPDGRVLIGGFRNADVEKEVGFSDEINLIIHEKLEAFLDEHFPLLRGKRIDYRWSGVMGFAADGYPLVGSINVEPRIFYTVGFTAHGLGFTFKMGQVLADLMLDGKDPGIFSGRRLE